MKLKSLAGLLIGLLVSLVSSASASTLTYTLLGPQFTYYTGDFTGTDRITGYVSFDSGLLDPSGNGLITTASFANDPGIAWEFTDGHNLFNSTITTNDFAIQMSFASFSPTGWNLDTTFGVTWWGDIFALDNYRYESYYQGGFATANTYLTPANWTVTSVPETAHLSILAMGAGFLGLARYLSRRRAR